VDGIAIGAARSEVEALLGAGEQVGFREHAPVYRFGPSRVAVTFGRESQVIRVSGNALLRDGQPVLVTGQDANAVVATLGEGYIIERFTPTTSGVFTTGSVPGGTEFYYDDGTARYQIYVNREAVIGGIHSGTMQDLPRPER
jgi:hypothetical protein